MALVNRILGYLSGTDSRGNAISWPFLRPNFTTKYNEYQRDSIGLQIVDLIKGGVLDVDGEKGVSLRSVATMVSNGITTPIGTPGPSDPSTRFVWGQGRGPKISEVVMEIQADAGTRGGLSVAEVTVAVWVETYLPRYANGDFKDDPFPDRDDQAGHFYRFLIPFDNSGMKAGAAGYINVSDLPRVRAATSVGESPGYLGGYWANNYLRDYDQNGNRAGIDFFRNYGNFPDPDQSLAAEMHSWTLQPDGTYFGSGDNKTASEPSTSVWGMRSSIYSAPGRPGSFTKVRNDVWDKVVPTRPNVTSLRFEGGLAINLTGGRGFNPMYVAPMDAMLYPNSEVRVDSPVDRDAVLRIPLGGVTIPVPGAVTVQWCPAPR